MKLFKAIKELILDVLGYLLYITDPYDGEGE